MNVVAKVYLTGELLSDEGFLITGKTEDGAQLGPEELAGILFAWDEHSFYGTFVEKTEHAVTLDPTEALRFFTNPRWLQHIDFIFTNEVTEYKKTAFLIQEALASGNFAPNFSDWKKGKIGWKLIVSADGSALNTPIPVYANQWLSSVINESISSQSGVKWAWGKLLNQFPAMYAMGEDLSPLLEESEWLQSIGWLPDHTPFRTCLRVVEPENGLGDWHLRIFLQDRKQPEHLFEVSSKGIEVDQSIPAAWMEYWGRFLSDLQKCREIIPWLAESSRDSLIRTTFTNEEAWEFLAEGSLQLVQAGIHIFLPAWWEQVRQTKPRLKAKMKSSVGANQRTFFGISQVMDFEWRLAIGSVELSESEFQQILEQKQKLIKSNGQWIQLTPELISQLQKTMKKKKWQNGLTFRDALKIHLMGSTTEEENWQAVLETDFSLQIEVELDKQMLQFIHQLQDNKHVPLIDQPSTFHGSLRKYQLEGSSWLLFLRRFGFGACLADDMGLGKTVQFITYLLHRKEFESYDAPALLICPTSVIGNWQKELERFAPSLKICVHYGSNRRKGEDFLPMIQGADLVITSYTLSHLDMEELSSVNWSTLCLDEAQYIKNAYTKQATAIRDLNAEHRIAMTGTPIENRLTELWSIFDFLNPGYLGGLREFTSRFVQPIERDHNQERIEQVQRLIQPFLLRRVKTDPLIQLDLPEKTEGKEFVPLTLEQGALYESTIQNMFARLEETSPMERRGLILTTLTRLKQICDHPGLVLRDIGTTDEKHRSHKIERLLELIEGIRLKGERCLLFTQYIEMGNLLQRILISEGYGPVFFLNGSTPKEKRDQMISQFQDPSLPDDQRPGIFILSLRAGGTGLNLTEANHVFHIDRWWNPAVENQATDRAYRIGQQRNVEVHKFITLGTLEERIDQMMERKLNLSDKIVGSGEGWITELSTSELRELFTLRKEWLQ